MCYNCGCGIPDDDMGHPDNITNATLAHLGEHWGKSLADVQKIVLEQLQKEAKGEKVEWDPHIIDMFDKASKAWGQSVKDAKRNTLELLKDQVKSS